MYRFTCKVSHPKHGRDTIPGAIGPQTIQMKKGGVRADDHIETEFNDPLDQRFTVLYLLQLPFDVLMLFESSIYVNSINLQRGRVRHLSLHVGFRRWRHLCVQMENFVATSGHSRLI